MCGPWILDQMGILVLEKSGKLEYVEEKPFRKNNKLNPHDAGFRNRTQDTLVEGEHSHHCTTTKWKGTQNPLQEISNIVDTL